MVSRILILFICLCSVIPAFTQEADSSKSKWSFNVSADIVSRYVWRGSDFGNSPAIQPDLEISYGNFTLGTWGSATFSSFSLQETDLFVSFEFWKFKFSCWDYFYMNMDTVGNSYFKYSEKETGHDFSFDTEFKLSEKIPLKLLLSYNFYGADTLHTSYFELSYSLKKKIPLEILAGFTPSEGWYGNGPGFVNLGFSMKKECKISDDYSLPVYCKIIFNPQKENIHLVAGITF
ncbi:MAG: hypothetical protein HY951_01510 [Bacteroidia bacterium]|nr:hypothetical protein [Bacteroidia bacterium]